MAWDFEEPYPVARAAARAGPLPEELWDRVEHTVWLRAEIDRSTATEKQREFRSRQHGRVYHRDYERDRRQRGKQLTAAVRCCATCRKMYTVTATQHADGTRFCSRSCGAKHNYHKLGNTGTKTRLITIDGKSKPLPEWAAHFGITVSMVYRRIRAGMTEVEALTAPKTRK